MRRTCGFAVSVAAVALLSVALFAQSEKTKGANPAGSDQAASTSQSSPSGAEAQIRQLDEQMRQSALQGDATVLEKYLAPNYIAISADGGEVTREQAIEMRKRGKIKYDNIDVRDTKVRMYGNTAIVTHDAYVKLTSDGQPISGEHRATFVWVKQGGKWQVASFSAVPVQGSSSAAANPEKK